jgi:transcriptional regulator with XRE-family HTH domain
MAIDRAVPPLSQLDRNLGRRLAHRRLQLGLTAAELERSLGIPSGGIIRIEMGERSATAAELLALSKALGVAIPYFFEDAVEEGERQSRPRAGRGWPADRVAEAERFLEAYFRIADARVRDDILRLIKAAAGE